MRSIVTIIDEWSHETGIGATYICGNRKKRFKGKLEKCPHCGTKISYTKTNV
jgi:hypothetical protein